MDVLAELLLIHHRGFIPSGTISRAASLLKKITPFVVEEKNELDGTPYDKEDIYLLAAIILLFSLLFSLLRFLLVVFLSCVVVQVVVVLIVVVLIVLVIIYFECEQLQHHRNRYYERY